MEGTSSYILQLILVCAFVCLASGQSCPSQHQTSAKFTVSSRRNQTGHWISQVKVKPILCTYVGKTALFATDPHHMWVSRASYCMSVETVSPGAKWPQRDHE